MKIALVTGGTGKIGNEVVLHLLAKGYSIVSTFNKSLEKVEKIKSTVSFPSEKLVFLRCDLSKISNVHKLFEEFKSKHPSLDLLINCAGIFPKKEFTRISEEEYDYIMNLNLKAVFFLIQKFSGLMKDHSVVINFSSVGGIVAWKNRTLYHISKAALIALTRSLALELAPKIRVVSIAPGYIEDDFSESEKMPLNKIPLQRYGKIKNIIQTIDFIIDNDYLTGLTIPVDGGRTLV